MLKTRSTKRRSPGEKFRDDILLGYPEWPTWSRKLRRIFVCLPSYGVGKESLESMCEDFGWDYPSTFKLIENHKGFKKAINEFVENGYKYRIAERRTKGGTPIRYEIKWSALQHVYMLESGITSFIKAETGKISIAENKLIEKAGLLEIEPVVNLPNENSKLNDSPNVVDISGESSLYELESSLNGA